jgi:hypothetical protein
MADADIFYEFHLIFYHAQEWVTIHPAAAASSLTAVLT